MFNIFFKTFINELKSAIHTYIETEYRMKIDTYRMRVEIDLR